jgi:membrane-associated protease RseP (regulator of RpoE activity)
MTTLMFILGIVLFAVGLLFSIAWHELGHLSTAKMFGIRVPQYMVGFGPTLFSKKKGDTEYGVKAIPFGGYIRMIGMFPPGPDGRMEARSTSPWRGMIEDARSAAFEELQPGDEKRLFYTRKPWKRVIVMFAGPFMNLILAVVLFLTVLMGFGISQQTTTVSSVSQCVISQSENRDDCAKSDPASPAAAAGLKAGDKIVSFDGVRTDDWDKLSNLIRATPGQEVPIVVERGGRDVTLHAQIATNQVAKKDSHGQIVQGEYVTAGFLGFSAATGVVKQDFGQSVTWMGDRIGDAVDSLAALPGKIPALWDAAFGDGPREADSPMGVVAADPGRRRDRHAGHTAHPAAGHVRHAGRRLQPLPVPLQHAPAAAARRRPHRGRAVGVAAPEHRQGAAPARPGPLRRGEADAGGVRGGGRVRLLHPARPGRGRRQSRTDQLTSHGPARSPIRGACPSGTGFTHVLG